MIRWIIKNDEGLYQYNMTSTGCRLYERKTVWGPDINRARLFTTKSAASNSLMYSTHSRRYSIPPKGLYVRKVEITIREVVEE